MPAGQQTHRLVPLSDAWYVSQLQTMVATLKIPMERRNKRTGRTEKARIWEVTDRTVRTWIGEAVAAAAADGVTFSVPVTPHTFRHSYAMHMLYAGIPLKVLQSLMGISPSAQRRSTRRCLHWMWLHGTGCSFRCLSPMRCLCSKEFHKL
uniref:Tyrosine recombinase XerD n=1 Tax=Salmonella enterica subsp. enterica serovar London TaxID=149390 RepID=A0A3G8EUN9_SALET|nr:Tyrosine recombinase XerD [Salmonella enterica subsp. enterica serovar London]